jgi:hypothetical protein
VVGHARARLLVVGVGLGAKGCVRPMEHDYHSAKASALPIWVHTRNRVASPTVLTTLTCICPQLSLFRKPPRSQPLKLAFNLGFRALADHTQNHLISATPCCQDQSPSWTTLTVPTA